MNQKVKEVKDSENGLAIMIFLLGFVLMMGGLNFITPNFLLFWVGMLVLAYGTIKYRIDYGGGLGA